MKFNERTQTRVQKALMFGVALGLTIYEAAWRAGERPFLLTLYASMMGLPLILGRSDSPGPGGKP